MCAPRACENLPSAEEGIRSHATVASHHKGARTEPWSSTEKHVLFTSEPNLFQIQVSLRLPFVFETGFHYLALTGPKLTLYTRLVSDSQGYTCLCFPSAPQCPVWGICLLVVRGAETQTQGFVHAEPAPTVEPHPSHLSSDTCLTGVPAQSSPAYQFTHPARSSPVCQFTPIQAQSVFLLCFCILLSCHCCFCFYVPPRMSHCLLTFWFPFPERQTRG